MNSITSGLHMILIINEYLICLWHHSNRFIVLGCGSHWQAWATFLPSFSIQDNAWHLRNAWIGSGALFRTWHTIAIFYSSKDGEYSSFMTNIIAKYTSYLPKNCNHQAKLDFISQSWMTSTHSVGDDDTFGLAGTYKYSDRYCFDYRSRSNHRTSEATK